MPYGIIVQFDPQALRARQACRNVPAHGEGNVKLGRSPGWNLARADRSRRCIYAYVKKKNEDLDVNDHVIPIANTSEFTSAVCSVSSVKRVDEYALSPIKMELDLTWANQEDTGRTAHLKNGSNKLSM